MNSIVRIVRGLWFCLWVFIGTPAYGLACAATVWASRPLAFAISRRWGRRLLQVAGATVLVEGHEKIRPDGRYIFISNHVSSLDIPILMGALVNPVVFMAKKELFRIPVFGYSISAMGHIPVDRVRARNAREAITAAATSIRAGDASVILFPEGTRSPDGSTGEFKNASFQLVKEAQVDVVPLYIDGAHRVLPKKAVFPRPETIRVVVGATIPFETIREMDKKEISALVRGAVTQLKPAGTAP